MWLAFLKVHIQLTVHVSTIDMEMFLCYQNLIYMFNKALCTYESVCSSFKTTPKH